MTERLTEIKYNGIVSRKQEETGISCSTYCDSCSQVGGNCKYVREMVKKLSEYETAEEEGRLVVLPCKVGDTVYVIENKYIEVFEVNEIELKHKVFGDVTYYLEKPSRRGCLYKYYDSELGDKWFIAREEAEKALKEMEGK